MSLDEDFLGDEFDRAYRYFPVGRYSDKEGSGALYYDAVFDDFYKEKDFKYLVRFEAPVKGLLKKLLRGW